MDAACMDAPIRHRACRDCGELFYTTHHLSKRCGPCQRMYRNAQTSIRDKARRARVKAQAQGERALGCSYEVLRDNGHRCRSCRRVLWLRVGKARHHCHQCRDGMAVAEACQRLVSLIVEAVTHEGTPCTVCGEWTPPWRKSALCGACVVERNRQKARQRYEAITGVAIKSASGERPCRLCDRTITPDHSLGRGRSICDYCNMHRRQGFKGRAMMYGVPYEHVSRAGVFRRDGWRCQLCSRKVLRRAKRHKHTRRLHPRTASLDHIIPMSKGGPHSERNVQCACLQCNVRKNARLIGQQRLF